MTKRAKKNPAAAAPKPTGVYPSEVDDARAAYAHGYADAVMLAARELRVGVLNAFLKYAGGGTRTTAYIWGFWHAIATGATKKRNPSSSSSSARAKYKETHGGLSGDFDTQRVRVPDPRAGELVVLGPIRRIEYVTDKGESESIYHHDFGREFKGATEHGRVKPSRRPILAFNREGLVICGGRYVVRPEGIVG